MDKLYILGIIVLLALSNTSGYQNNHFDKKGDNTTTQCHIIEYFKRRTLLCNDQNLTYIPHCDSSIEGLIFGYNLLTSVSPATFVNISNPKKLMILQLDHNMIENITSNSLDAFIHLDTLYLSGNPIFFDDLKHLMHSLTKLRFFSHLRMSQLKTITINMDLFSLMLPNNIWTLELNSDKIASAVNFTSIFGNFDRLKTLFLKWDNIEEIVLSKSYEMNSLIIDHNNLNAIPDFSINENETDCYFPNLEFLSIQSNNIRELRPDSFRCLNNLKHLTMGANPVSILPNNFITKLPSLFKLDISYMTGETLLVEPCAFNSTSVSFLSLKFHGAAEAVFVSLNDTFKYLPNLKYILISRISMLRLTDLQITWLFSSLEKLEILELYACEISTDPKVIVSHMKNLKKISLQSNLITNLSADSFQHNKRLSVLDLRFNQLGHIFESSLPKSVLNKLHDLDFSHNPFICDCDLKWFINWLKTNRGTKVTVRYPQDTVCFSPAGKHNMLLSDVSFTYRECHPWSTWIWLAVIGSPVVVVVAISAFLLYRNRWNIKHYIYLLRKRRNYQAIEGRDYLYDAFVAYESEDSAWVCRTLLPVLEDEVGLKLCIHERDFQAGVFINDNIVNSMNESHKIVLVLTNAFARSGWCMFELKVAHSKLIEEETELVVIMLEKIDARNMNNSLRVLFDTTTYIEWTEDAVGQELFLDKLKDALNK